MRSFTFGQAIVHVEANPTVILAVKGSDEISGIGHNGATPFLIDCNGDKTTDAELFPLLFQHGISITDEIPVTGIALDRSWEPVFAQFGGYQGPVRALVAKILQAVDQQIGFVKALQ